MPAEKERCLRSLSAALKAASRSQPTSRGVKVPRTAFVRVDAAASV